MGKRVISRVHGGEVKGKGCWGEWQGVLFPEKKRFLSVIKAI